MLEIESIDTLRKQLLEWRLDQQRIAFVPTMGNLHAGHLSLVEAAGQWADRVVVSIFVNPLQFGAGEDFANYPRTLAEDKQALDALDVDLLFIPSEESLYPVGRTTTTRVLVPGLSDMLCGAFRPGHFVGVATVVAKLFNLVQPDIAIFGKKDYQQLLVIRRLAAELNFPIEIVGIETVRESDGLAMSSRNRYLNSEQRQQAATLYQILMEIADKVLAGSRAFQELEQRAIKQLNNAGFQAEYVAVRRRQDMQLPQAGDSEWVVLAAARLGSARLIDNVEIGCE